MLLVGKKLFLAINTVIMPSPKKCAKLIKKRVNENFEVSDSRFALGICGTCRPTLTVYGNGKSGRTLSSMPNYTDIILPNETRTNKDSFNCFVCLSGKYKSHPKIEKRKAHKNDSVLLLKMDFIAV